MDFHIGIGVSSVEDSTEAGRDATKKALEKANITEPDFMFVFAAPSFDHTQLLSGITSVTNAPMIGGTTAGEISHQGYTQNSVVVTAIKSSDISFSLGVGKEIDEDEVAAGIAAATMALANCSNPDEKKTFLVLTDGLAGDGTAIIEGIHSVLGEDFEIAGGALGDEADFEETFQYFNGQVLQDSVVGVLLSGNFTTSTGIRAGWESVGTKFTSTKSDGNILYELDGKPALDVYKTYLGPERSKKLPEIALEYPFGIIDEKASIDGKEYFQLRAPLSVDDDKKSITFAATIPEGKDVTITAASRKSIIDGSATAAEQASKTLNGAKPLLILDFDCIGRKLVLGPRANEEIDAVREVIGRQVPIAGFFTYGEIGPIDKRVPKLKSTRFHNQTTVLWVLGAPIDNDHS